MSETIQSSEFRVQKKGGQEADPVLSRERSEPPIAEGVSRSRGNQKGSEFRVQSFRDLKVWQRGMSLVTAVYKQTNEFPKEEQFGLTSQMRRAAVSVPSNVAEGSSKRSTKEFIRFLNLAYGSLAELGTQWEIAGNLSYAQREDIFVHLREIDEIGKMLNGLINSLENKLNSEL